MRHRQASGSDTATAVRALWYSAAGQAGAAARERLPPAGPDEVAGAHPVDGLEPRHRAAGLRGPRPPAVAGADAGAGPGRRVLRSQSSTAIAPSRRRKQASGSSRSSRTRRRSMPRGQPLPSAGGPAAAPRRARRQHGDGAQRPVGFGRRPGDRTDRGGRRRRGRAPRRPSLRRPAGGGGLPDRPRPRPAATAQALGLAFALPEAAPREADIVFHASASAAGWALALSLAGDEATIVELSWYGTVTGRRAARPRLPCPAAAPDRQPGRDGGGLAPPALEPIGGASPRPSPFCAIPASTPSSPRGRLRRPSPRPCRAC